MGNHALIVETVSCRDCGWEMVAAGNRVPKGCTQHHGRGLCHVCYWYHDRHGTLEQYPITKRLIRSPDKCKRGVIICAFCETVQELRDAQVSPHEWARRLGTTNINMARRLWRHGKGYLASQIEPLAKEDRRARRREKVAA